MASLDDDMKDVLVELCLQKWLVSKEEEEETEQIDNERHLTAIKGMMCEVLLWGEHCNKTRKTLEYHGIPEDAEVALASPMTCGGMRFIEFASCFLTRMHPDKSVSYKAVLLRPIDAILEIGQLHVLAIVARAISNRLAGALCLDAVTPETPNRVQEMTALFESIVADYAKRFMALDIRGDRVKFKSYLDCIDAMKPTSGKYSASLSNSRSLSSTSLDEGAESSSSEENIHKDIYRINIQQQKRPSNQPDLMELNAYLAYVWVQISLNRRGRIGVEDVSASEFRGSVLENELLVALKFDTSAVSCFCMIVANGLARCGGGGGEDSVFETNPLRRMFKAFLSDQARYDFAVNTSVQRIVKNVEERLGWNVTPHASWESSIRNTLWLVTASNVARATLKDALDAPGLSDNDIRLYSACTRSIKDFTAASSQRIQSAHNQLLHANTATATAASDPPHLQSAPVDIKTPKRRAHKRERTASTPPSDISNSEDSEDEEEGRAHMSPLCFEVGEPVVAFSDRRCSPWVLPRARKGSSPTRSASVAARRGLLMGSKARAGGGRCANRQRNKTAGAMTASRVPDWIAKSRNKD